MVERLSLDNPVSFQHYAEAVEHEKTIMLQDDGTWTTSRWCEYRIINLVRKVLGYTQESQIDATRQLARYLITTKMPVQDNTVSQPKDWVFIDTSIQSVVKTVSRLKNEKLSESLNLLEQIRIGYTYLGKSQKEIDETAVSVDDRNWLIWKMQEWQVKQFPIRQYIPEGDLKNLHPDGWYQTVNLEKLERACQYPMFMDLLRRDPRQVDTFFKRVFRNFHAHKDAVDLYVQFLPIFQNSFESCLMNKRFNVKNRKLDERFVRLIEKPSSDNTLPQKSVEILTAHSGWQPFVDPSYKIQISKDETLTVNQIIAKFKETIDLFTNIEILQNGLQVFDGEKPPVDLSKDDWWKDLPIYEKCTKEEAEKKYGIQFRKQDKALLVVEATRTEKTFSLLGCHSFMSILFPLEDGTFNRIPIGVYPSEWPTSFPGNKLYYLSWYFALLVLGDTGEFMNHRERTSIPIRLNDDQFKKACALLREYLQMAQRQDLPFQPIAQNCALFVKKFVESVLGKEFPDLYRVDLSDDFHLSSYLKPIIFFVANLIASIRQKLPSGRVMSVTKDCEEWKKHSLCHASKLPLQAEEMRRQFDLATEA